MPQNLACGALMMIALAGCRTDDAGLPPVGAALVSSHRSACEAGGGIWGAGGAGGLMVCYRPTRDGGESCGADRDCEGFCLARSRTCAPVTPLYGCNDVLGATGQASRVCLQ